MMPPEDVPSTAFLTKRTCICTQAPCSVGSSPSPGLVHVDYQRPLLRPAPKVNLEGIIPPGVTWHRWMTGARTRIPPVLVRAG